jgi:hypothetical protein
MGSPARPENSRPGWAKSAHGARLGPKMHVLPKDGPGFFGLRAGIGPRFFARRLGHKRLGPRLLALGFFWSGPTRKIPRYTASTLPSSGSATRAKLHISLRSPLPFRSIRMRLNPLLSHHRVPSTFGRPPS